MTRRSSGFTAEGKCFTVLIPGKAGIRRAGLFTRVMLSSFAHPSQVMTSTLMSDRAGASRGDLHHGTRSGFEVETPAVWQGEALAAERVDVGLQRPGDAVEGDQRHDQRALAGALLAIQSIRSGAASGSVSLGVV